jgi:hypothetical protein
MVYLIDPKTIQCQTRCKPVCLTKIACPLDLQHPLYGIPT